MARATYRDEDSAFSWGRLTWFIGLIWLVLVAVSLILKGERNLEQWPDPDDAMRIVEVRDLLHGQPWHDLTQHRLDPALPPNRGVPMHWSRLVDTPLAALIAGLTPVLGPERAEDWAILIWPLLPGLLLLPASAAIGGRLAGRDGAYLAALGAAFAAYTVSVYAPARIDHHNIQIALGVALIAALMSDARRLRGAALAGIFSGLTLTIGMETLPYVVLGGLVIALRWAMMPAAAPRAFFAYTLGFAMTATLGLAIDVAPDAWLTPHCDVVSSIYLVPLWIAVLLSGVARVIDWDDWLFGRSAVVLGSGLLAVVTVAAQNRTCLSGPYAEVDPLLFSVWMDHIREARSAGDLFTANPVNAVAVFALPVIASLATLFLGRGSRIALLALGIATAVALWQVRSLPFAAVLAAPILAAGAVRLLGRAHGATAAARLVGAAVLSNPILVALVATIAASLAFPPTEAQLARQAGTSETDCLRRSDYRTLAGLKPGLVLGNIAFGPLILAETPHSVLAAPYHRNRDGILDAVAMLTAPPDEARALIAKRGIAYLAICARSAELDTQLADHPGSLFAALRDGDIPDWLERVPDAASATAVFIVRR